MEDRMDILTEVKEVDYYNLGKKKGVQLSDGVFPGKCYINKRGKFVSKHLNDNGKWIKDNNWTVETPQERAKALKISVKKYRELTGGVNDKHT
jgi:hypothetical protein